MLRARDAIDRAYAKPLDIPSLASVAHVSEAHFIRTFHRTFGETLQDPLRHVSLLGSKDRVYEGAGSGGGSRGDR